MGLFSFFSKNPEKTEQKGDAFVEAEQFGSAKLEYEQTLDIIKKKHPDDSAMKNRVLEKLIQSKEALARQHMENGDHLVKVGIPDEAGTLFKLARQLTEDNELKKDLKHRLANLNEYVEDDPEVDDDSISEETQETREISDMDEFHILCATMPDEMADEYLSYGEPFIKGYLALSRGDFESAANDLKRALENQEQENTYIPLELSTALIHLDQAEEALERLNDFMSAHPESIHGFTLLCDLLCVEKMYEKARHLIDSSPDSIKNSLAALLYNGRIYSLEGNYVEAEALYKNYLDHNEWSEPVARAFAETLEAAGKKDEARDMFADLLNSCAGCGQRPDPTDKKKFADLSFELDDLSDKTLELYLTLAKEAPQIKSDCYDKVSKIYRIWGNEKEAARYERLV